jgi:hypothetical protein
MSKGPQMLHYKHESQLVVDNSIYELYYDRSIVTHQPIHNNRLAIVILDKAIKDVYLIAVAIPHSHNLHSTIIKKLQKYTDLEEELTTIWQLKAAYTIPLVLSTPGIISNKLHISLKLLNCHPALYIIMQKAVILHTCHIVRKVFCRTVNNVCLFTETFKQQLNCCKVNMDDDDDNNNQNPILLIITFVKLEQ